MYQTYIEEASYLMFQSCCNDDIICSSQLNKNLCHTYSC